MSTIACYQNNGYACVKWITPMMEKLVQQINQQNIEFYVNLIPPGYYATDHGCYGYIGPQFNGPKPPFSEQVLTLECNLPHVSSSVKNIIQYLCQFLTITPGGFQTYNPFVFNMHKLCKYETYFTYLIKKPGFDAILESLKVFEPKLTDEQLCRVRLSDSVEKYNSLCYVSKLPPQNTSDLICKIHNNVQVQSGETVSVNFGILEIDIAPNFNLLVHMLQLLNFETYYHKFYIFSQTLDLVDDVIMLIGKYYLFNF